MRRSFFPQVEIIPKHDYNISKLSLVQIKPTFINISVNQNDSGQLLHQDAGTVA